MSKQRTLSIALVLLGLGWAPACEQTLRTGKAGNTRNAPSPDGACPAGLTACGAGAFAQCLDLQNDAEHCGACDRTCVAGIACASGVCQQTVCKDAIVPLATGPTASGLPGANGGSADILLADVNGDGHLDLVSLLYRASGFGVSLGQPGGGFAAPDVYSSNGTLSVSATDVNLDGVSDLLVVSSETPWLPPSHVEVWLGHQDGRLRLANATSLSVITKTTGAADVAVGDISGDGLPDLVMPADMGDIDAGNLRVCLSDSSGALHVAQTHDLGGQFMSVSMRDWNGDASPDLVVTTVQNYSLALLYNRGDGTFAPPVDCGMTLPPGPQPLVEDFNRDGYMDLALASSGSGAIIGVALGLGGCAFTPYAEYDVPGGGNLRLLRAADMNGDGQLDLVAVGGVGPLGGATAYVLGVLLGRPDGTFALPGELVQLPTEPWDVTIGEVTGDQRPDVILSLGYGTGEIWRNTCQ